MIYLGPKQVKSTLTNMYYYRGKKTNRKHTSIYTFALQEQEGCTLLPEEEQLEAAISLGLEQWTCLLPARPDLLLDLLLAKMRHKLIR